MIKKLLLLLWFGLPFMGFAQVIYWSQPIPDRNNQVLTKVMEVNGSIFALGKASSDTINNPIPVFYKCDQAGKIQNFVPLAVDNLHELAGFSTYKNEVHVYGTVVEDSSLVPYEDLLDANGSRIARSAMVSQGKEFIGDIFQYKGAIVIGKSVMVQSGVFNCQIEWYMAAKNNKKLFTYTVVSPFNEELNEVKRLKDGSVIILAKRYTNLELSNYVAVVYKVTAKGKVVFSQQFDTYPNFYSHSIITAKNGNIYYTVGVLNDINANCFSIVTLLLANGEINGSAKIKDILTNGGLENNKGEILLYGCNYKAIGVYTFKKARIQVITASLLVGAVREFNNYDPPDAKVEISVVAKEPSSSELFSATMLSDGRILAVGRLFTNDQSQTQSFMDTPRNNYNMMVFLTQNGNF